MKKALILILLSLSSACGVDIGNSEKPPVPTPTPEPTKPTQNTGGSPSGSGMLTFASTHGFVIRYNKKLTLTEDSEDQFTIDNTDYLKGTRTPANNQKRKSSSIIFKVVKWDGVANLDQLEAHFKQTYPDQTFERTKINGTEALKSEKRSDRGLVAEYFFMHPEGKVVEVYIDAQKYGNGVAWVAPIVETYSYDTTPPTIHDILIDGPWLAGQPNRLRIRMTDENSGLRVEYPQDVVLSHKTIGDVSTQTKGKPPVYIGNDWYSFEFFVNRFAPAGNYDLMSASYVIDRAGNHTELWAALKEHAPTVYVINTGVHDIAPPVIHEVRLENFFWEAGKKNRLMVHISDNQSEPKLNYKLDLGLKHTTEEKVFTRPKSSLPIPLGDGWFAIDFEVSPWAMPGVYTLHSASYAIDDAGNDAAFEYPFREVTVYIENPRPYDVTPPVIQDIVVEGPWVIGKVNRLKVLVTDDGSGIGDGIWGHGDLHLSHTTEKDVSTVPVGKRPIPLGDGWYAFDFTLNKYAMPGTYSMSSAYFIGDRAGNSSGIYYLMKERNLTVDVIR